MVFVYNRRMKQILQNLRNGKTELVEVPCPNVRPGFVLIKTAFSLVSAGTERMVVEFAEKNLLGKAQSRPDLVLQVVDKARREGILPTIEAALNRLDQPMVLGYSSSGIVQEVGDGVHHVAAGDWVACAGGGYAVHAEYAVVPKNLVVKLPEGVDLAEAAFTTLGAIAMHGFRLSNPQIGERVGIIGLGLLGLMAGQIAAAAGCEVFGVDINPNRVDLGRKTGIFSVVRDQAKEACLAWSLGCGCDVVLICADTKSDDPVDLAAELARDRGRIVAVGAVGMDIPRKKYYEKELSFQVSRSYGPGRYDPLYEEKGQDYPFGYIRWTEGRNLDAFIQLLRQKKIQLKALISHRFPIDRGIEAYELITGKKKEDYLGVLLEYPIILDPRVSRIDYLVHHKKLSAESIGIGIIGAGLYANSVFLPVIKKVGMARMVGVASASGVTAQHCAKRFGMDYATSNVDDILDDESIQGVVILTRHSSHSELTQRALSKGKAVYCEKPLVITREQLLQLEAVFQKDKFPLLMVGFNRRFSDLTKELKKFLSDTHNPAVIHYRINAGFLPAQHWLNDPNQGGGRIIGEACHFIDFITYLIGNPPVEIYARSLPDMGRYSQDNVVMNLLFSDGSIGTITYVANGDKALPKERLEVFCDGSAAILDDFRRLELYKGGKQIFRRTLSQQDKGHMNSWRAFIDCIKHGGPPPIPYSHLFGVTASALAAVESIRLVKPVAIDHRFLYDSHFDR